MKHTITFLIVFISHFSVHAQKTPDGIIGVWLNDEKTNKIEIYKDGDTFKGRIVWIAQLDDHPGISPKDKNNPNPEKRNQSILGMDIITGLKYSKGKWLNGTIYNPQKGIYADCKVELPTEEQLDLIVSKGVFSKTKRWIKQ